MPQYRGITKLVNELRDNTKPKAERFPYPWSLWKPWFPDPSAVPGDLRHYLSKCLFHEALYNILTLWVPERFDKEYREDGGLADALALGIFPFGSNEFDYCYMLSSGEIHTFHPLSYAHDDGPIENSDRWDSLHDFLSDALDLELKAIESDKRFATRVEKYNRGADADPMFKYKENGYVRIHGSASKGDLERVKKDLEAGVDPNIKVRKGGSTPILLAARAKRLDVVELLLDWGADVTRDCGRGERPIDWIRMIRGVKRRRRLMGKLKKIGLAKDW